MSLRKHLITEHSIDATAKVIQSTTPHGAWALHDEDHDRMDAGEELPFVTTHSRDSREFVAAIADRQLRKARE